MQDKNEKQEPERISGTVDGIVAYKPESGFVVFDLDMQGELVTVVGELGKVEAGEEVSLTGTFASHPTYGTQFRADVCERRLPASATAIRKYLSGGSFKGVGPALAKRIVEAFGEYTLEVIENTPLELARVKGVSQKLALEINEEFQRAFGARKVMTALQDFGLPAAIAVRAWKKWGTNATDFIKENPYLLCDPDIGLEFADADAIFIKKGDPHDIRRLKAGIKHVLAHNLDNGHTCLPEESLLAASAGLLGEADEMADALEQLIDKEELCEYNRNGRRYIYLPELFIAETTAAGRLKMMLMGSEGSSSPALDKTIELLEEELGIEYDSLQKRALKNAVQNHVFVLTGGPGTGKTTTLNALIRLLEQQGDEVLLAAPTGRAAKRLSELTGHEAKTIHRLLEVDYSGNELIPVFRRNERNPLKCDTLIVDEMSMVDSLLFDSLLRALPFHSRLVMVGDSDQLPSVGAGNVLHDLIRSDILPSVRLDTIFRQAAESMIVTNAHDIVNGEYPYLESKDNDFFFLPRQTESECAAAVCQLCEKRLPKAYGYSPLWDIQVLCPGKRGEAGTWNLNIELQKRLNPPDGKKKEFRHGGHLFREGDKVMQTRNDYDMTWTKDDGEIGRGVFNGDIGIIEKMDPIGRMMAIRFDDRVAEYPYDSANELDHAYAVTVHKSQGSEFEAVIIPLFEANSRLYYRNLLYTAVTRAKKLLIIVGSARAVMTMVDNNRKTGRFTNLRFMIKD
ncbi:MAG: ATP-dependent RecD-like DNA helicase [Oscillospiraceae bacterium]|nr:ATP-dependent RecD-like DNA helicase [Oscillospiraceae bacterium]